LLHKTPYTQQQPTDRATTCVLASVAGLGLQAGSASRHKQQDWIRIKQKFFLNEPFREIVHFQNKEPNNAALKTAPNTVEPMPKKVTAKRLRDLENIAKILQYIEETNPTPQQLKQKFQKPTKQKKS
jgi:hypothetical protein